jgi:hypothetical protein
MIEVPRRRLREQILLFTMCFAGVVGYSWSVVTVYRAHLLAAQSNERSVEIAASLAPRNADIHDQLCRFGMFSSRYSITAISECRKASELNPYSSSMWLDLAQAYYLNGDISLSDVASHKALSVDPTTPDTIWNVANFLMVQGNVSEAIKQFAIVLEKDPPLVPASLNVCWHSVHDVNRIQNILPPNPAVYLAFIRILDAGGEYDQAGQVWSSLMRLKVPFDYRQSLFYVDDLIQAGRADQGSQIWRQLGERSTELHAYIQPKSLVMDGSFAQEILNSGFDWRYNPNSLVEVTLDSAQSRAGGRSLRLGYSGVGSDPGIFQYVAVHPASHYRLSAWVKSEGLNTANGPTLSLLDAASRDRIVSTQDTTGTTSWHFVQADLTTGNGTTLLVLSIARNPEQTAIQGRFWIADIRLEPL